MSKVALNKGLDPTLLKRKDGWMRKKGGVVHSSTGRRNWKRRYFILVEKENANFKSYELQYWDKSDGTIKGTVTLDNAEVFCEERTKQRPNKGYEFQILLSNGGTLQLSCDDGKEREEWMETLNMIIAYLRKMKRASTNTLDGYDPLYEDEETIFRVGSEIALNCQAFGPGLFGAEVGQYAQFAIQMYDLMGKQVIVGGMPFTATLTDENYLYYLRIVDNEDGTYGAHYIVSRPGIYSLNIRLNDEHDIYGSPFEVNILPSRTVADKCTAEGDSLVHLQAGVYSYFTITARDTFSNQKQRGGDAFEVGVMGPAQLQSLVDNGDGTYQCCLIAQNPSEMSYYATSSLMVIVTLQGKHINGSPCTYSHILIYLHSAQLFVSLFTWNIHNLPFCT